MRKIGKNFLEQEKIDAILASASTTVGLPILEQETTWIKMLASDTRRIQKSIDQVKKLFHKASQHIEPIQQMAPVVGHVTATVLYLKMGSSKLYHSPNPDYSPSWELRTSTPCYFVDSKKKQQQNNEEYLNDRLCKATSAKMGGPDQTY